MARKKKAHLLGELMQSSDSPQSKRDRAGEKTKTQTPVSTVGEERAFALGFTMIAFSILMYFVVGISVVKPSFQRYCPESSQSVSLFLVF
ncbi:calcium-activated potassium channel subunit beta-3-like [Astyanax mexicanus]|uniref:Calcium-activated potassium channel subunit beta-3-like n=1 Tax=Astyanax mexicanus TaxID=7994 RepID=A0A8T2LQI9_ASTMX|nr:calcium-activated potassium channel subunit beta-3-like [Astyanax mexicanus]